MLVEYLYQIGIKSYKRLNYNLSYEELFKHETRSGLSGYERVFITKTGAIAVDTGIYTGRSPKDKYIVYDKNTSDKVWWADGLNKSDNKPLSEEKWKFLYDLVINYLNDKELYINDVYVGASEKSRLKLRLITEIAWASHFTKNMFIEVPQSELKEFMPDFLLLHAPKLTNAKWKEMEMNSEIFIVFNFTENIGLICGTWYGGEIKKGMFTVMNYYLPQRGILSMHCSANIGKEKNDVALFFGLSGTGKTSLSTDPKRLLIGDDEHGWDDDGIFNLEGGCYAKCINLDPLKEKDIYNAIRKNAILENVVYDEKTGEVDFKSAKKTENTRASYPLYHIDNVLWPISKAGHPENIIFLTADAFGVLPPISILDENQIMYYFINGYTSKLAGTERGIIEPIPAFSACFGAAFLPLPPTTYATMLKDKIKKHKVKVFLINTGWVAGPYGVGYRIDINITRKLIDHIFSGVINKVPTEMFNIFNFKIPQYLPDIDSTILNPINLWKNKNDYINSLKNLAIQFINNSKVYESTPIGKEIISYGPCV